MSVQHYWLTKDEFIMSSSKKCPLLKHSKKHRIKYIGFTSDIGWPKKMNTGRIFYQNTSKKRRKKLS